MNRQLAALAAAMAASCGAHAAGVSGQGTWEMTLQARDIDGNGVTDAFYDTDLNITWLRNANAAGIMTWGGAVSWAADLTVGAYSDWRLPYSDACFGFGCSNSDMGHLWHSTLGNAPGGPMNNTGAFIGLLDTQGYWTGNEYTLNPVYAWEFYMYQGLQRQEVKRDGLYAMAVRDGDVMSAVPEPAAYALAAAGLAVVVATRRRKR